MGAPGTRDGSRARRVLLHGLEALEGALLVAGVTAATTLAFVFALASGEPAGQLAVEGATVRPPGDHNAVGSQRTIYIVASEAEAGRLRVAIEEANVIRHYQGLAPLLEDVLVAPTPVHAAEMIAAIREGNRILAGFNVEDQIVNLAG